MSRWFRRPAARAQPSPRLEEDPSPPSTAPQPAPVRLLPAPPAGPAARAPRKARSGPLRTVVVDDDRALAEQLRDLLADLGVQVLAVATGGDQALAVTRMLEPDVVLTDLRMPGMDGIELTRELQQLPEPPAVVVLSAYDDPSLQDEAAAAGASAYLAKGSSGADVLAALRAAAGVAAC